MESNTNGSISRPTHQNFRKTLCVLLMSCHDQRSLAIHAEIQMSWYVCTVPFLKGWKRMFLFDLWGSQPVNLSFYWRAFMLCSEVEIKLTLTHPGQLPRILAQCMCVLVSSIIVRLFAALPDSSVHGGSPDKDIGVGCPQYSRYSYLELHMIFLANHHENIRPL